MMEPPLYVSKHEHLQRLKIRMEILQMYPCVSATQTGAVRGGQCSSVLLFECVELHASDIIGSSPSPQNCYSPCASRHPMRQWQLQRRSFFTGQLQCWEPSFGGGGGTQTRLDSSIIFTWIGCQVTKQKLCNGRKKRRIKRKRRDRKGEWSLVHAGPTIFEVESGPKTPVLRWLATDWPWGRCISTKTQAALQEITWVWRCYTKRHLHADLCFSVIWFFNFHSSRTTKVGWKHKKICCGEHWHIWKSKQNGIRETFKEE